MKKYHVLFNTLSGNGDDSYKTLSQKLDGKIFYHNVLETDYDQLIPSLDTDDVIVICGGDGSINKFINRTKHLSFDNEILYFATGTGNDFLKDLDKTKEDTPIRINEYLKDLPTCYVDGKEYKFINGVGYGIDGYCCEEGDRLRAKNVKNVNYTGIAIKGLLFHYKPTGVTITVDGEKHYFAKNWISPVMLGRYYGGGMMPCPEQRRDNNEKKVSVLTFHGSGKLKTLMIFPSIFKGEHVKHTKLVKVFTGHEITVEHDEPRPVQVDGETILNVKTLTVKYGK
ncbi:MAG: diacylglycerol kinase family protein [Clostridia bacterium]|nr:diacylglycerol kinase family protein [Clostridia bacterium]